MTRDQDTEDFFFYTRYYGETAAERESALSYACAISNKDVVVFYVGILIVKGVYEKVFG